MRKNNSGKISTHLDGIALVMPGVFPQAHCKTHPIQSCIIFSVTKDTMQGDYWLFGNEVKAHAVEQLVLLQHHRRQRVHLLHVEVELDASRRVSEKVSLVLEARWTSGWGKLAAVHTRSSRNTFVERCVTVTHCWQSQNLLLDRFFFVVTHPGRHCHFWGDAEISPVTKQAAVAMMTQSTGVFLSEWEANATLWSMTFFF